MTDPTALMEQIYSEGMKKVNKLEEEIAKAKAEIKGAEAYLLAVGKIKAPSRAFGHAKGRRSKEEIIKELREKDIQFDENASYAELIGLLKG